MSSAYDCSLTSVTQTVRRAEYDFGDMSAERTPQASWAADHLPPSFPERAAWGTANKLRAWQSEALDLYFSTEPRDFLASATPGAGKTTFALRLASVLLHRHTVRRVVVVAPTEHLKHQWAEAAARASIRLDPTFRNSSGSVARHYHGTVVTYAQIAAKPWLHSAIVGETDTLVILDEVHHAGDTLSWGDAIRDACAPAKRRLSLTGTPFRSDTAPIPFVAYLPDREGIRVSQTDYSYGYGRALRDGVVRPVIFMVYAGEMRWKTRAGDDMTARLGEGNTADVTSQAWRTALDPAGDWIPSVLSAADRRLTEVRRDVPDAAGLVLATDQSTARAYARQLEAICGEPVTVVLSDESDGSEAIDRFSQDNSRWMVAVRMVSEGVDIPRLAVGVYATSASTPLYFAQAVGRFVRARRRGETATIFLPNVPVLLALAQTMEQERDHALDRRSSSDDAEEISLLESANRQDRASETLLEEGEFVALGSEATFDRVVYDGDEFGAEAFVGSEEEWDFIGIPGLLEPDQVKELLRVRQQRQARKLSSKRKAAAHAPAEDTAMLPPAPLYRTLKDQRKLLNSLVGLWAKRSGRSHAEIHVELRSRCGGPATATATVTQLQQRIDLIRRWLAS